MSAAPLLDLCPSCGQKSDSDVGCSRCGASLRVDLWLEGPAPAERTRFLAARAVATLAIPGLGFSELKRALTDPAASLAAGLPRSAARAAIGALGRCGVSATAGPSAPAARPGASPWRLAALGGTAVALVALGAFVWARGRDERSRAPAPPSAAPLASDAAGHAPAPRESAPAPPVAPTPAPVARLTTQELASLATGSVAEVSCRGQLGTAFFFDPEHAATNAHAACGKDEPLRVRLSDGRELIGKTVTWEKRLDLAVIEVMGAAVKPLELGDSTALEPGDPLVLVGNPHGLSFTVHEGRVSYVGRNLLGNAYVQVNASVNPGNSGGPLLDGRGQVVGIVSMKVTGADGIGLALPIEYLRPFAPQLPAAAPEAQARWQATLERIRLEDASEVEKYRSKYQRPTLVAVWLGGPSGLVAAVLRRWPEGPSALPLTIDVQAGDRTVCSGEATVQEWEKVEESLDKALRESPDQPRLVWSSENRILRDVFSGTAPLDLGGCALEEIPASAVLIARGGEEAEAPIRLPQRSAMERSLRMAEEQRRARRAAEASQSAREEAWWRNAFRRARSSVAALEAKRDKLRALVASSTPASDDRRRQLAEVEAELARTKEALEDLERKASSNAVPRAWRA